MTFNKNSMLGQKVRLYPGDTYKKIALIKDVSHLGFTFEILESEEKNFNVGSIYFVSHSKPLIFEILYY